MRMCKSVLLSLTGLMAMVMFFVRPAATTGRVMIGGKLGEALILHGVLLLLFNLLLSTGISRGYFSTAVLVQRQIISLTASDTISVKLAGASSEMRSLMAQRHLLLLLPTAEVRVIVLLKSLS